MRMSSYAALDWLLERQDQIERRLARRHLEEAGLAPYDLSSAYLEGRHCQLARIGYSRDGKRRTEADWSFDDDRPLSEG